MNTESKEDRKARWFQYLFGTISQKHAETWRDSLDLDSAIRFSDKVKEVRGQDFFKPTGFASRLYCVMRRAVMNAMLNSWERWF